MPHEFFTPLAGIIGLSEILQTDFTSLSTEEVADIHKDIYLSALRLHRTLRNYLLILELQKNSAEITPLLTPPEVEKSIRAGLDESLRLNPRREDVTLRLKAPSITMKAEDLGRTVEELADNAFKFSRQGTPVTVEMNTDGRLIISDQGGE